MFMMGWKESEASIHVSSLLLVITLLRNFIFLELFLKGDSLPFHSPHIMKAHPRSGLSLLFSNKEQHTIKMLEIEFMSSTAIQSL